MAKVQRSRSVLPAFALNQLLQWFSMLFVTDVAERSGSNSNSIGTVNISNRTWSESHGSVIARQQGWVMMAIQWQSESWVESNGSGWIWRIIKLMEIGLESTVEEGLRRAVLAGLQQPVSLDFLGVVFCDGVLFQNSTIGDVSRFILKSQVVSTDELERWTVVGVFEVIVLVDIGKGRLRVEGWERGWKGFDYLTEDWGMGGIEGRLEGGRMIKWGGFSYRHNGIG